MGIFDSGTGATVSIGASRGPQYEWDGSSWTLVPSNVPPPTRQPVDIPSAGSGIDRSGVGVSPTASPSGGFQLTTPDPTRLWDELRGYFPWLDQLGIDVSWFQDVAVETLGNPDAMLVKFRQLPQYRSRFPGLWRQDGSLRMNEAEYIQTEDNYRRVLRQAGFDESLYSKPADLVGLFESEQDPNELAERVDTYRKVRDGSQAVRDAFYVYAGMDVSVDDLFEATIDKNMAAQLENQYVERVSTQTFDYQTFIDRVTQVAGQRAADLVSQTGNAVTISQVRQNPELTRQILDVLYTSGTPGSAQPLALDELLAAYEEAVIGAAASNAGLSVPSKERVAELRLAGVERATAQRGYLEYARLGGSLSGASQRVGLGELDQNRFEQGAFLGDAQSATAMQTAVAAERAAGQAGGGFRFDQDRSGRLFQRGLTT